MTAESQVDYTDLVMSIASLVAEPDETKRNMHWVHDETLGLARTSDGRVELFVQGARARSRVVARNSRMQPVYRRDRSDPIQTLCVSLPALAHFDQFAAFICSELERVDVTGDLAAAFRQVEPLLELAFARHLASTSALTAFVARLVTLEATVQGAAPDRRASVVAAWFGSRPWRDLSMDSVGAIVRGTDGPESIHHIRNVAEVTASTDEDALLLVSIGLTWQPDENSSRRTALEIVDNLAVLVEPLGEDVWRSLVDWMEGFRKSDAFSYVHATASSDSLFNRPFAVTFKRSYDLTARSDLITTDEVERKGVILGPSVTYTVQMPAFADERDANELDDLIRALNHQADQSD